MDGLLRSAGFWGFLGSLFFASGRILIFLGQEKTKGNRALILELLKFGMAVMSGPIFAVAFVPVFIKHFDSFDGKSAALTIGLLVNTVAPALVSRVEKLVDTFLSIKG